MKIYLLILIFASIFPQQLLSSQAPTKNSQEQLTPQQKLELDRAKQNFNMEFAVRWISLSMHKKYGTPLRNFDLDKPCVASDPFNKFPNSGN